MKNYIDRITSLGACSPAIEWLYKEAHPNLAAAWAACDRADWMLWLAARYYTYNIPEQRIVVGAAAECAAAVLDLVPAGNDCFRTAVETAQRWAQQKATSEEVRKAAHAASRLISLLETDALIGRPEHSAALAARQAADTALVENGFFAVAICASATVNNAAYAAFHSRRTINFAEIVRRHIPNAPVLPE